jgi:glutaredoxin
MTMAGVSNRIELYWMPGCSACLRAKEFLEASGLSYHAVNVDEETEVLERFRREDIQIPAVCVGDKCVNAVHLGTIAEFLGIDYTAPEMLSPATLAERYRLINQALRRYAGQMTADTYTLTLPNRSRLALELAAHAATLMRYFVAKYYDDSAAVDFISVQPACASADDVIQAAAETLEMFDRWWERDGFDDPFDGILSTYWGHRTMHEALEREVWHTAQHTRQIIYVLETAGITPERPLGAAELAGLPLPERVHE